MITRSHWRAAVPLAVILASGACLVYGRNEPARTGRDMAGRNLAGAGNARSRISRARIWMAPCAYRSQSGRRGSHRRQPGAPMRRPTCRDVKAGRELQRRDARARRPAAPIRQANLEISRSGAGVAGRRPTNEAALRGAFLPGAALIKAVRNADLGAAILSGGPDPGGARERANLEKADPGLGGPRTPGTLGRRAGRRSPRESKPNRRQPRQCESAGSLAHGRQEEARRSARTCPWVRARNAGNFPAPKFAWTEPVAPGFGMPGSGAPAWRRAVQA